MADTAANQFKTDVGRFVKSLALPEKSKRLK